MKNIVRVTLSSREVDDDYELKSKNEPDEEVIMCEFDGFVFIGAEQGDEPVFISLDPNLQQITPHMQFVWWATMGWQGFYGRVPPPLRSFMDMFKTMKDVPLRYAQELLKRHSARAREVESGQINYEHWDADLFSVGNRRLHSLN